MKLVGKVPVEPLSEERLTNIERSLVVRASEMSQRPMRAPRRVLAFAGVAMAVGVAAFVGWKLRGDGRTELPPRSEQLVMKGGALELGDAQITGNDFVVTRTSGRVEVVMQKAGKLELHIEHKPGRLFVVRAGDVEIQDVGTKFSVDYDGKNVEVRVTEGEVKVKHAGKDTSIVADNAWTIEIGPITIAALDAKLGAQAAAAADPTTGNVQPGANNVVAVAPVPNVGSSGGSAGSNQGSGARPPRKIGGPDAKKALEKWPDEPFVVLTDIKNPTVTDYLNKASPLPEGEEKAEYYQSIAVMYLRAKNYQAASRILEGVLHQRERAGKWTEWRAYKSALWLDVRAKCLASRTRGPTFDDACRVAAEKYIARFPTGAQAGAVQQVLSEI